MNDFLNFFLNLNRHLKRSWDIDTQPPLWLKYRRAHKQSSTLRRSLQRVATRFTGSENQPLRNEVKRPVWGDVGLQYGQRTKTLTWGEKKVWSHVGFVVTMPAYQWTENTPPWKKVTTDDTRRVVQENEEKGIEGDED